MKTKIGTSFGLALILALGVMAVMLALGTFNPSRAGAATDVTTVIVSQSNTPVTPGATAAYTINFNNQDALTANSGQIWVYFDSAISVPSAIEKERITLSASGATAVTVSNPAFDPDIETTEAGNTVVKITVGDTDTTTTSVSDALRAWDDTSTNSIGHTIKFSTLAGLQNSVSPSTTKAWTRLSTDSGTTVSTACSAAGQVQCIPVYRHLILDDTSDARGKVVTLTGKGWDSGETATVFLDISGGTTNVNDTGDIVIAQSDATISGGEFTATFTVDTNFSVGANSINAVDGVGGSATNPAVGDRYTDQVFTLYGKVSISPDTASRGGTIALTLSDFTGVGPVTSVTVGGVPANLSGLDVDVSNNSLSLSVAVPSTTPLGTQSVAVTSTTEGSARSTSLVVSGLTLTATPSTAVANQAITVSASGFTTAGADTPGAISTVTVGGIAQTLLTSGSAVTTVATDNSGNLVATFKIPNNDTTRTAGTHVLRITDNGNRIGETDITVPARSLILDVDSSKRGSTVNYTGDGFIASTSVSITYAGTTVDTVTADSAGNISGDFKVPTSSGIPSSNTVAGTSSCTCTSTSTGGVAIQLSGSATHKVPGAVVTVGQASAASGDDISISGTGFPGYVGVDILTIGGVSAKPSPTPATDGDGVFTLTALVPELSTGSHSLIATVGTGSTAVTATTSFTVVAAAEVTVVTTNATEDVFADEITADNLVRVWSFDNSSQEWSFYDPRPAFSAANSYTDATSANIVWVNVTAETTFQGSTLYAGWNLISLD